MFICCICYLMTLMLLYVLWNVYVVGLGIWPIWLTRPRLGGHMTYLASRTPLIPRAYACLVNGTPSNNGHYNKCMYYVYVLWLSFFMFLWKYVYEYMLDFPCWALGSFLFVYMCRKVDGGEIRGCLEIVYRRWTDSRNREFGLRGCSLNFIVFICIFPHLWCNPLF